MTAQPSWVGIRSNQDVTNQDVILSERSESKDPDAARAPTTADTFSTAKPSTKAYNRNTSVTRRNMYPPRHWVTCPMLSVPLA